MQTVKQIIEELQRFNPEARVEPEIKIDGVSPATCCKISFGKEDEIAGKLDDAKVMIAAVEELLGVNQ